MDEDLKMEQELREEQKQTEEWVWKDISLCIRRWGLGSRGERGSRGVHRVGPKVGLSQSLFSDI